jgi:hypothetical protein
LKTHRDVVVALVFDERLHLLTYLQVSVSNLSYPFIAICNDFLG